jgi:hypothetical protein
MLVMILAMSNWSLSPWSPLLVEALARARLRVNNPPPVILSKLV